MELINQVTIKVVIYDKTLYLEWIKFNSIFFGQDFYSAKLESAKKGFSEAVLIPLFKMDRSDFRLRSLLLQVDRDLTDVERQKFCFLIGCDDVPRRYLDAIAKDNSASMTSIWETLFDRRKITVNNVNYIIERLDKIQRLDLAELLRNYCPLPFSLSTAPSTETKHQTEQRTNISDLFSRIDP
ncbi:unnamed protein product [Rotaria socialis]|uniref:DED domain-containing protein n=1 Tax=Rotaria socialis TaxID=392032 RepID=A0A820NCK9_9BILA|nr:unnamed protein product [Rotaria socialis]CAF4385631.1 unnamed protein product [Rotaria socialis]CAF4575389.1 unnamed protein product [Rotaria socialis]